MPKKSYLIEERNLWEIISFPLGFVIGIFSAVVITIIIKGVECVA